MPSSVTDSTRDQPSSSQKNGLIGENGGLFATADLRLALGQRRVVVIHAVAFGAADAGIIDQHVDTAEGFQDGGEGCVHRCGIRNIASHADMWRRQHRGSRILVQIQDRDAGALGGQAPGYGGTDPLGAAGYHGAAAGEALHACLLF